MKSIFVLLKRGILNNKGRTILSITSIVIAVAVMVSLNISIDTIKSSIVKGFNEKSLGADVIVKTGTVTLNEDIISKIAADKDTKDIFLRINSYALYSNKEDNWVYLVGIDIPKEQSINSAKLIKGYLPQQEEALISKNFADKQGLDVGKSFMLRTDGGEVNVKVSGIVENSGISKYYNGKAIIMNSENVQKILDTKSYSEANISLKDGVDPIKAKDSLQTTLGSAISVFLPKEKSEDTIKTLNSLFLGFNIFGALAFILGIFLISNTMQTMVINSIKDIAVMKVIGYNKKNVFMWIMFQSLFYGVIGALLGLFSGIALSNTMTTFILGMLGNVSVSTVQISWIKVISLSFIGILVSVMAGASSALHGANITVVDGLAVNRLKRMDNLHRIKVALGIATAFVIFFVISWHFNIIPKSGYLFFASVVIAFYFIIFLLIKPLIFYIYKLSGFLNKLNAKINSISLTSNIRRTVNTVFVIIICTAMSVGLNGVIGSFKQSILDQTKTMYTGDILINAKFGLNQNQIQKVREIRGVEKVTPIGFKAVLSENKDVFLNGIDPYVSEMKFNGGDNISIREKLINEDSIIISKTMSSRLNKKLNDFIEITTEKGPVKLKVIGYSKSPDQNGTEAFISLQNFDKYFPSSYYEEFLVKLSQQGNVNNIINEFGNVINDKQVKYERIDEYVRDTEKDLNNTFSVFYALTIIAYFVGGLVIVNSVHMTIREMKYQISILKSLGLSKIKMFFMVLDIGFIYGLIGSVIGAFAGIFINYSFVWLAKDLLGLELGISIQIKQTLFILLGGIVTSMLASVIPSLKSYKVSVVNVLTLGEA